MITNLNSFIKDILPKFKRGDIFFFGVGNPYRADDGFGIEIVENLKKIAPENSVTEFDDFDGKLLELTNTISGKLILFFDVSDFSKIPGAISIFKEDDLEEIGKSFHKVPLKLYMRLLRDAGNESYLIAVQPKELKDTFFEPKLSSEVKEAIEFITEIITKHLKS